MSFLSHLSYLTRIKDLRPLLKALYSLGLLNSDISTAFIEINKKALMEDVKCISVHVISPGRNLMGILIKRCKLMSLIRKSIHSHHLVASSGAWWCLSGITIKQMMN